MKINKKNFLPVIIAVIIYLLSYQIPKISIPETRLHYLNIPLDDAIPLFSPAILIYFLAYIQWIYAIFVTLRQDNKTAINISKIIIVGSLIGFMCFVIYPTAIVRPQIMGSSIFDKWLKFTYQVDNIINACPSFHCFVSTIVIYILYKANAKKKILYSNIFLTFLVYISTLLTKQHVLVDVPAGILLAIISILLVNNKKLV